MKRVTAYILAGGEGRNLAPLTDHEAKPAVSFGGGFRLIDFSLVNCARSGVPRAVAVVQHRPDSLLAHLRNPPRELLGQMNLRTVQPAVDEFYLGAADAVRQNLRFVDWTVDDVLILPGDQIYRMDYARMLEFHQASGAEITVATLEVPREEAARHGVVATDEAGRIVRYTEQPADPEALPGREDRALVSMGIFLFKRDVLTLLLDPLMGEPPREFGADVLPAALADHRVMSYEPAQHDPECTGYWRDIDTLHDFWSASMEFLREWRSILREEGGSLTPRGLMYVDEGFDGRVVNSFVPAGLELLDGEIRDSILAANVQIKGRVQIVESIVQSGVLIEDGCEVRKAILDREARLTGEARVDPRRNRPGSQIKTISGLTVVPRGVLVRGPAKIPRPCASMPRPEDGRVRRAGLG